MKILFVSTFEDRGGAAVACKRLAAAILNRGIDASMLVCHKDSGSPFVVEAGKGFWNKQRKKVAFILERLQIFLSNGFSRKNLFAVSTASSGIHITDTKEFKNADIIHLHWINQGFLSLRELGKIFSCGKPVVWTIHDMWPVTGICHHSYGCENFKRDCGECTFLHKGKKGDLSYRVLREKKKLFYSGINTVSPSNWLRENAEKSILTKNSINIVIPNPINTDLYCPADKKESRKELGLPLDKIIVTMGAAKLNDPIKGFSYLKDSVCFLENKDKYCLAFFGNIKDDADFFTGICLPYVYLGEIKSGENLKKIYAASDMTVVPSLYETFGQTLSESLSCGRPVVSFNNSGQTDIIDHKVNGYLANYKDPEDFAAGIEWIAENYSEEMEKAAREKVISTFSENVVASKYIELYQSLLKN